MKNFPGPNGLMSEHNCQPRPVFKVTEQTMKTLPYSQGALSPRSQTLKLSTYNDTNKQS